MMLSFISGWPRLCKKITILPIFLILLSTPRLLLADDKRTMKEPDMELILFIGSFTDTHVGWVDPFQLQLIEQKDSRMNGGDEKNDDH